jgi:DNA-binding PadR family transcriptional regulator
MKFLSRQEELLLLTILKLRDNAYGVPIREHVAEVTGKYWSIGAIYDILDRLSRKGLVAVSISDPLKIRGGKSKRYYRIAKSGFQALEEIRALQEKVWSLMPLPDGVKK